MENIWVSLSKAVELYSWVNVKSNKIESIDVLDVKKEQSDKKNQWWIIRRVLENIIEIDHNGEQSLQKFSDSGGESLQKVQRDDNIYEASTNFSRRRRIFKSLTVSSLKQSLAIAKYEETHQKTQIDIIQKHIIRALASPRHECRINDKPAGCLMASLYRENCCISHKNNNCILNILLYISIFFIRFYILLRKDENNPLKRSSIW